MGGHTSTDAAAYRPEGEADGKWSDDPIERLRARLTDAGVSADELDQLQSDATNEMTAVYETARDASFPPAIEAYADVQDLGDPRQEAF